MSAPKHDEGPGLVLGVIVPCRNEVAVIERKLRNLVIGRWPFSQRPHQIVVVDDGSNDGTAERARELCAQLFAKPSGTNRMSVPMITDKVPAAARVIVNGGPPGKLQFRKFVKGEMMFTPPLVEHATLFTEETRLLCVSRYVRDAASHEADLVRMKLVSLDTGGWGVPKLIVDESARP